MTEFVVCIHDGVWTWTGPNQHRAPLENPPRKGQVYTVTRRRVRPQCGRLFLRLAEYPDIWFLAKRFRPVQHDLQQLFRTTREPVTS